MTYRNALPVVIFLALALMTLTIASQDDHRERLPKRVPSELLVRKQGLLAQKLRLAFSRSFETNHLALPEHTAHHDRKLKSHQASRSQRQLSLFPSDIRQSGKERMSKGRKSSNGIGGKMIKNMSKSADGGSTASSKGVKGRGKGKGKDDSTGSSSSKGKGDSPSGIKGMGKGSSKTGSSKLNGGSMNIKGNPKRSKTGMNEPTPTRPSRPTTPTINRPMTPSAISPSSTPLMPPTSRPAVAATPFTVSYSLPRRLSTDRHLQTSEDFAAEAAEVTIEYLEDYIEDFFRRRGIFVADVDSESTLINPASPEIGYAVTVTFTKSRTRDNLVDRAISKALEQDGDRLIAALQTQLSEDNPFSRTAGVSLSFVTPAPTIEPTTGKKSSPPSPFPAPPSIPGSPSTPPLAPAPSNMDTFAPTTERPSLQPSNTTRPSSLLVPTADPSPTPTSFVDTIAPSVSDVPTATPQPTALDTFVRPSISPTSTPFLQPSAPFGNEAPNTSPVTLPNPTIDTASPALPTIDTAAPSRNGAPSATAPLPMPNPTIDTASPAPFPTVDTTAPSGNAAPSAGPIISPQAPFRDTFSPTNESLDTETPSKN